MGCPLSNYVFVELGSKYFRASKCLLFYLRVQGVGMKKLQSADTRHNMNKDWILFRLLISG